MKVEPKSIRRAGKIFSPFLIFCGVVLAMIGGEVAVAVGFATTIGGLMVY